MDDAGLEVKKRELEEMVLGESLEVGLKRRAGRAARMRCVAGDMAVVRWLYICV